MDIYVLFKSRYNDMNAALPIVDTDGPIGQFIAFFLLEDKAKEKLAELEYETGEKYFIMEIESEHIYDQDIIDNFASKRYYRRIRSLEEITQSQNKRLDDEAIRQYYENKK